MTSGVLAGAALVFLHALKELPATLLLAPIGFETLATDIFRQTTTGFFEAGAIPALILLLIAAPPLYLLNEKGAALPLERQRRETDSCRRASGCGSAG